LTEEQQRNLEKSNSKKLKVM